jgi:hypothetical protein
LVLDTLNWTAPAVIFAGLGAHPCGVRSIVTVVVCAEDADPDDPCELEQADASSASEASATMLGDSKRVRRPSP